MWSGDAPSLTLRSVDISRSGIALEATGDLRSDIEPGTQLRLAIESLQGQINAVARVIRVDKNWLANKTVIGLEFTELEPQAVSTLDKVLVLLGGKPRNEASSGESSQAVTGKEKNKPGLSGWMKGGQGERKSSRFVGNQSQEIP